MKVLLVLALTLAFVSAAPGGGFQLQVEPLRPVGEAPAAPAEELTPEQQQFIDTLANATAQLQVIQPKQFPFQGAGAGNPLEGLAQIPQQIAQGVQSFFQGLANFGQGIFGGSTTARPTTTTTAATTTTAHSAAAPAAGGASSNSSSSGTAPAG